MRGLTFACGIAIALVCPIAHASELPRAIGMYPPGANAPLAMVASKIEVTVRGPLVEATITQTFVNHAAHATEATYVFPLPLDAAVTAMAIKYGERTIHAAITKRDEAQRRYEDAVRAGIGAGLLDQERADVFTQTVSAIPPRGRVDIVLRVDTLARFQDGQWELALPMVVAPRYVPGKTTNQPTTGTGRTPDTDRAPDASRITPAGAPGAGGPTTVAIRFAAKPSDVVSPTHDIKVANDGGSIVASFTDPKTDHDAIVRWRSAPGAGGWVEAAPNGGFAAVVVEAPPAAPRKAALRCTLVLDRSASSRGDAEAIARPLVRSLLAALGPNDRIAVAGSDRLEWGTPSDIARAIESLWSKPAGAFDLTRTLRALQPQGAPIILVSSGLVADDRAAVAAASQLGVAIHVLGVGPAPARGLLAQLASASAGTLRMPAPGDDLAKLANAVVGDAAAPPPPLTVTWGTLAPIQIVPGTLPRLGSGQSTVVVARVGRVQAANARTGGQLFALEVLPPARLVEGATTPLGPLGRRWAKARLDELLATRATPAAITEHALAYGLVSPHTSMVAIGEELIVSGGVKRSIAIPVSVPAGMQWQAVRDQLSAGQDEITRNAREERDGRHPGREPTRTLDKSRDQPVAGRKEEPKANEPKDRPTPPIQARPPAQPSPLPPAGPRTGASDDSEEPKATKKAPKKDASGYGDMGGTDSDNEAEDKPAARSRIAVAEPSAPNSEVQLTASRFDRGRIRLAFGVRGGVVAEADRTSGLLAFDARLDRSLAGRWVAGIDSSLWLVGREPAGRILASVGRFGIARWFELGAGGGLQLGPTGLGPAVSGGLRVHLPQLPPLALILRYDFAWIIDADQRRAQSAGSLGLELGF